MYIAVPDAWNKSQTMHIWKDDVTLFSVVAANTNIMPL